MRKAIEVEKRRQQKDLEETKLSPSQPQKKSLHSSDGAILLSSDSEEDIRTSRGEISLLLRFPYVQGVAYAYISDSEQDLLDEENGVVEESLDGSEESDDRESAIAPRRNFPRLDKEQEEEIKRVCLRC